MANKWNQHPKLPRCWVSLYKGDCLKTWSSHTSEETQVEKEVLLLKVWDLFKMVFLSIATIFKCTETHQELYEKLPMFPLPRIRTPTSIFCSTSPIALSLLLLKYLKACPISCHLSPSYSSEHLFKKKKIVVFISTISSLCLITLTGILWSQCYPGHVQSSSQ